VADGDDQDNRQGHGQGQQRVGPLAPLSLRRAGQAGFAGLLTV